MEAARRRNLRLKNILVASGNPEKGSGTLASLGHVLPVMIVRAPIATFSTYQTMKTATTFLFAASFALTSALSSCKTDENHGLTIIAGDHFALPKITHDPTSTEIEIYESTEGVVVKCRKDCAVTVSYDMTSTNYIALLWNKIAHMRLSVSAEPLSTDPLYRDSEVNAPELGVRPPSADTSGDE